MSYRGDLLVSVHFFIVAPIVGGACLIMLFSVDERRLGENNQCRQHLYVRASHCVVSLSKTHLSLFSYWFNPGRPVPIYLKNC